MVVAVPVGPDVGDLSHRICQPRETARLAEAAARILAGIPTVVYGFFAALTVAPNMREFGGDAGWTPRPRARWPPAW
jgi:phosphate transport system permease protein